MKAKAYKVGGLIGLFVFSSLFTLDFEQVISRLRKSVVPIKFTIKRTRWGSTEIEEEIVQRAIIINNDLVVITDGGVISDVGGWKIVDSASVSFSAKSLGFGRVKPKFARVYIGKDIEVPAKFLGLNKDYDLAYFQLKLKPGQKLDLQPLEVVEEEKLNLKAGDEVYRLELDTKGKKFGFPFWVRKDAILYKFEGSKYDFSIGWNFEIIVDPNLNILGFGFESPITRRASKREEDFSTSGYDESVDNSRYGLLFTKSKLTEIIKGIPKEKKVGWLGFLPDSLEKISEDLREELKLSKDIAGLRVASIPPKVPAELAGLKVDDIIIEVAGKKTVFDKPQEVGEFFDWLNELEIGKEYKIKFIRNENGKYVEKEANIVTIEKPTYFDDIDEVEFRFFGIKVKPITYDYKYDNRLADDINGLVVVFAKRGDPFNVAGIYAGDIILAIGKGAEGLKEVRNIDDFKNILKDLRKDKADEILVKVYTGGYVANQFERATKEIKIKTVRLGERNYRELEKDLEE